MANTGNRLNYFFKKRSIAADLIGFAYSTFISVAPMFVIIIEILLMAEVLDFDSLSYINRELFSCTILYTFIFSVLTVSPFNAVLSKYMQDAIFEERFQDIMPCYNIGLFMNMILSCLLGIPFCLWEHFVGGVNVFFVFTGYCGYVMLVMTFYTMIYLSICKDYLRISVSFFIGMLVSFILSLILRFLCHWGIKESMLFSLMVGFFIIAVLEYAAVKRYFHESSNRYKYVLRYFKNYWQLVVTNFFYILGLYIHNFVFWTTDMRMVLVKTFVCNQPYDMATCLAMFTNISATIIFISRIEMEFHSKYKEYAEAVIGGKGADIENAKNRMFRELARELMNLVRIQFIISVVIYLLCIIFLPRFGFAGLIMRIYPSLAAGYFIIFLMYSALLFLYYFNDMTGSVLTTTGFCLVTFIGSIVSTRLPENWYGLGTFLGAFTGWTIAYMRIRWVERHINTHVFCRGTLIEWGTGKEPSGKVFDKLEQEKKKEAEKGKYESI